MVTTGHRTGGFNNLPWRPSILLDLNPNGPPLGDERKKKKKKKKKEKKEKKSKKAKDEAFEARPAIAMDVESWWKIR